ncbi:hypothetical protein [Rhodanobacter sp. MP7CTX1]|uniref:hypothetical protein n=1 Tax=Rhodanobacter sp. MP7CTX1 TaxID=2723084 RepID=UPI00160E3906|nr:hypothetical protein [Rhodanobacter sp. MP7CTX1]MBB6187448.1 hypothetical protein [Rhodanobacter sp. MP7CTX1]
MNEFEWRRQMQGLRQPLAPQRDLWDSINAALGDAEQPLTLSLPDRQSTRPRRWLIAASLAASALLAVGISWYLRPQHAAVTPAIASVQPANTSAIPATWKPADPRFAGAAIELDAARMELQQAIQQAPNSPALQRLLDRTEHQQTQLRQLAHEAG